MTGSFRDQVWALIDRYKAELPPEAEQDRETKLWRLQLHRIDTRNFVEFGRTKDDHIIINSREPEPELQAIVNEHKPRAAALDEAVSLLGWGMSAFGRQKPSDDWQKRLEAAQGCTVPGFTADDGCSFATGGPAYVAAVCIRDHWAEMSPAQQEWCAHTACDAIEADADTSDYLSIGAVNPMEGSRPAAFVLPALFGKTLRSETQSRLLPVLAKAVIHAVEETVAYAMRGVARYLWVSDRSLALTCVQALINDAIEQHTLAKRPWQQRFAEQGSEHSFHKDLRSRSREFIVRREPANEAQIITLDIAHWPGRTMARHLFEMAAQNPNDLLLRQIMQRSVTLLPMFWERESNSRKFRMRGDDSHDEEPCDPELEHSFVDAICRFALLLSPAEALAFLEPVFVAAPRFQEKASSVVTWLIVHQKDRVPASTMWTLWQRFADDFVAGVKPGQVDKEHSAEAKMLGELFLGGYWGNQRDWLPLHGETQRIRLFFQQLPPMEQGFVCYAHYLAKIGTPTLPDALLDVGKNLSEATGHEILNETATYYFEEILTRLIYGGNSQIRANNSLRQATLMILDALVASGSSAAYKLRDDFLTPVAG